MNDREEIDEPIISREENISHVQLTRH